MKQALFILCCTTLLVACGNSGETKTGAADSPSTTNTVPNQKGLELIGASDCTTCHRLQQTSEGSAIGPSYSEVARKYGAGAADTTIDRLVHKIMTGGQGVWGTTPMTPHVGLKPDDVREMVKYILSIKS
jgi:cytochrome c